MLYLDGAAAPLRGGVLSLRALHQMSPPVAAAAAAHGLHTMLCGWCSIAACAHLAQALAPHAGGPPPRLTRAALAALCAAPWAAQAQAFPTKPVRLIVTYPPGGSSDLMARITAEKLTALWGHQVLVESKPGAAGSIGMEFAARKLRAALEGDGT